MMESVDAGNQRVDTGATRYLGRWTDAPARWFTRTDGTRLRYIEVGTGPTVLLLHTVRTQLDLFQRVIPALAPHRRVVALDFPGMGWSEIANGARYDHEDLRRAVIDLVEGLDLRAVTLAGESMGAVVALTASIPLRERVERVVASNTYDYEPGLERANAVARVLIPAMRAPVIGPVVASLENPPIVRKIISGGFADPSRLPEHFVQELVTVGRRPGYPHVARAIYRNLPTLVAARDELYREVTAPVTLLYGDHDWSRKQDHELTERALGNATLHVMSNVGHFSALEAPEHLVNAVLAENAK